MLKKMMMCVAVAMAALVMFSGVASAAITGTPWLSNIPHTDDGLGNWTVTSIDASYGNGTLEIAGGSLLDMNGHDLSLGWGTAPAGNGTVTITGDGSKLLTNNGVNVGRNVGEGNLIIEDGGWFEGTGTGRTVMITQTGPGTVSVTGADSKLTSVNGQLVVGMYTNHIGLMTVEDSGLVQTKELRMGFDGSGCEGYVHMGEGGVLAVDGDKTTNPFLPGGMFTKGGGTAIGEIQYNPSDDGITWLNMTGATVDVDYALTYYTSSHLINGQDVDGYTVLEMLGSTPTYDWVGASDAWNSVNWDDGTSTVAPGIDGDMTIDVAGATVNVDADFKFGSPGMAASVTVGNVSGTNDSTLVIDSPFELGVTGLVDINPGATLTVNGTLAAATGTVAGTLAGSGTINVGDDSSIEVTGTVTPGGDGIGTLTLGSGEMGLDPVATVEAQVSLAVVGSIEADMSTTLAADQLVLGDEDMALQIGGTLAISSLGDRTDAGYWATSPVIINNDEGGVIGDTSGPEYTGREFNAVTPAPPAPGEPALHLGQGLFLRPGDGVTYVRPSGADTITTAVELDVLVALGGDADGDGKVWLSDWAALRANFGNTGAGKTWTEGNFDPWLDGKVWLSDWAALRANFGNASYTAAGAAAVPEPGTIAMLLGALTGLALFGWRRR